MNDLDNNVRTKEFAWRNYMPEVFQVLYNKRLTNNEVAEILGLNEETTMDIINSIPRAVGIPVERTSFGEKGLRGRRLKYSIKKTSKAREVLEDLLERKRFKLTEIDIQLAKMFMSGNKYTRKEFGRASSEAGSHINRKIGRISPYLEEKGYETKWEDDKMTGVRKYWGQKTGEEKSTKDEKEIEINKKELIKKFNRLSPLGRKIYNILLEGGNHYVNEIENRTGSTKASIRKELGNIVNMDIASFKRVGKLGEKAFYIHGIEKMIMGEIKKEKGGLENKLEKEKIKPHDIITPKKKIPKQLKLLYLAEMGFGTKAYDERAMDGLALFLKVNKTGKKIDGVIMQGALLPYIPKFYTVNARDQMAFLGKDTGEVTKDYLVSIEDLRYKGIIEENDLRFYEIYLKDGIVNIDGGIRVARRELLKVKKVLKNDIPIHYQEGEEDRKRRDDLIEHLIAKYGEETKKKLNNQMDVLREKRKSIEKKLKKRDEKEVGEEENNNGGKYKKLDKVEQKLEECNTKIRDIDENLLALKRKKSAVGFRRFTTPDQYNLFFRIAKKMHYDELYEAAKGLNFHVHSTSEKRIKARWSGLMSAEGEEDIETTHLIKTSGLEILLIHNPNFRSENVIETSIEKLKLESNFLGQLKELYPDVIGGVPDILLTAHGAGGFIFQPQMKEAETIVKGEEAPTPEYFVSVKLPTFQSISKLNWLKSKRIRNWHTKRLDTKKYASGAVIHTIRKDGLLSMEYIDATRLIEYGGISNEINEKRDLIRKYCFKGKKKAEEIEKIKEEIKELENKVKVDTKKVEVSGDYHLGVACLPGRPSNYQVIEAAQKYQEKDGLPDYVVSSELFQGDDKRKIGLFFGKQRYSPLPKETEINIEELRESGLSLKEKYKALEKMLINGDAGIPISFTDMQIEEWARRCLPYVKRVIDSGGKFVIASGNHYGNPEQGRDEATIVGAMLMAAGYEEGRDYHLIRGIGERFGLGEVRLDGNLFYISHKMWQGSDEIIGAMEQILRMGRKPSAAILFHRHQCGGGFANVTAYTLSSSAQPAGPYVDMIGKKASLRGIVNFYFDPEKRGYYKWDLVLDPVLAKYMKR